MICTTVLRTGNRRRSGERVYTVNNMTVPGLKRFVVPETVASQFHLHEGDTVADFGAGSGFFLSSLVAAVGESGRVYACEIQRPLVEKMGAFARQKGWHNVDVLWCDLEATGGVKIPDNTLDAGILVNTLFQIEDATTCLAELHRTLRPGGKLLVIDWTESFAGLGPAPSAVVTASAATDLCESNGFVYEREFPAGEHHYGLAFRVI